MSNRMSRLLAAMTCAASLSVYAAEEPNQPGGNDRPRQPPQAALDACKNSVESATCQFTGRDNEIVSGTCKAPRHSENKSPLACRPDRKDWKPKDGAEKDHVHH
ncbi:hypothetical protein GCM10011613_27570 [Cellvibrio zantedeschiae]|uniref:Uncharacterized protein n=1 Tax=Cellvibrio zantedeschiae TaxID=1237077 RepID=A0ABQ3B969_9GAMM|nr:hypothetical protein [Cellvibrio zantedeschiae]GGY81001.1 hypothetical protein GCM10011613_27570 [Cellvibrio zantedeschiae]